MAYNNTVRVTLKIRNDTAANWEESNPILAVGEFGLERDTLLLKIGDGVTQWNNLRHLNKLDDSYLTFNENGEITLASSIQDLLGSAITEDGGTITGVLSLTHTPTAGTDATNKAYVDSAVANAGHLKKAIVDQLPSVAQADPDTIYMIPDPNSQSGDIYKEYMLIDGEFVQTGDTSVDLNNLVTGGATPGNIIITDSNGALIDSGVSVQDVQTLQVATTSTLGGVLSGTGVRGDGGVGVDRVVVDNAGHMTLSNVSTSLLYVPTGDTLILDGGTSTDGVGS